MTKHSEPNAQNSELDPKTHPSGARIEKMMNRASQEHSAIKPGVDTTHQGTSSDSSDEHVLATQESQRHGNEKETNTNLATEGQETGTFGEPLRDSERPNHYTSTDDTAEGARDQVPDGHRGSRSNREV